MMRTWNGCILISLLAASSSVASATVKVVSLKPSLASPQTVGATVEWTATATDSNAGPLTFQFNIAPPGGAFATVKQFNVGRLKSSSWKSQQFAWALTGMDGTYQIQVVVKDFSSGESASSTVSYVVNSPIVGALPVIQSTANPLVALFTAPPCASGSMVRAVFQAASGSTPPVTTNSLPCRLSSSVSFEIAGMYPNATYNMFAQVITGGQTSNGPSVSFTTGPLPTNITFSGFEVQVPDSQNDPNALVLESLSGLGQTESRPNVATDLAGNVKWYYYPSNSSHTTVMTRSFPNGFIAAESGLAWNPSEQSYQMLRQFDWAGNIIRETNIGILQQQLHDLGNPDAAPCNAVPSPPPVGATCIGFFHHDAIQSLPNGYSAALVDVEKIFPPGTQGDTSGLPVDVAGDMVVVLDQNWNAVWYWDAMDPLNGGQGYPNLPVTRSAVLGEVCTDSGGCMTNFLNGPGVAPGSHDWLHCNTIYYSPQSHDLLVSVRNQDWVIKIDYQDGAGTGKILWRLGPSGDFFFVNSFGDPWPWFSHQHESGIENNGSGPFTVLDNGNTRVSQPGLSTGGVPGLGKKCSPNDCDSRGQALSIDEEAMQATPIVNADLGYYAPGMGSAQLLADGNYFFVAADVVKAGGVSYDIQIQPTPGSPSGPVVFSMSTTTDYRAWQMPSLYDPPTT